MAPVLGNLRVQLMYGGSAAQAKLHAILQVVRHHGEVRVGAELINFF